MDCRGGMRKSIADVGLRKMLDVDEGKGVEGRKKDLAEFSFYEDKILVF